MIDRARLTAALQRALGLPPASDVPGWQPRGSTPTPAAVLVPLVARPDGYTVLFTQRTDHLHHHAGQVSFPGGRMEAEDASLTVTALRETYEEIGLGAEHIDLVGQLQDYYTITGFRVTPVVGIVTPPFDLRLDDFEVAAVFEVPLPHLLDRRNHQRHPFERDGVSGHYYAIPWQQYRIWGATAGMLLSLVQALADDE